jgi:hypothetical protein
VRILFLVWIAGCVAVAVGDGFLAERRLGEAMNNKRDDISYSYFYSICN